MDQVTYRFQRMASSDLALVRTWRVATHVRAWWGDDTITLAGDDELFTDQHVASVDGRPFAYLQCYLLSAFPGNGLGVHPPGTRGIDQFIGWPDMVGKGHGSAFIRAFADGLLARGTPRVLTDPDPRNA